MLNRWEAKKGITNLLLSGAEFARASEDAAAKEAHNI
jgi:hypothetical protein